MDEGKLKGLKVTNSVRLTHLLFIDNMLLFELRRVEEWEAFNVKLNTFCEATDMVINSQFFIFYFEKWGDYVYRIEGKFLYALCVHRYGGRFQIPGLQP